MTISNGRPQALRHSITMRVPSLISFFGCLLAALTALSSAPDAAGSLLGVPANQV